MRVVHVEAGRHLYGGALQVTYLLRGLREMGGGRNVLVCSRGSEVGAAARGVADEVIEVRMGGELDAGLTLRLYRILRRERPDILHLHSRRGADLWGAIAGRLARVPVVLSRRVDNPEPRWLVRWKYRLYDHVITISEAIRQVLLAEGVPAGKVTCVHSAVDTERYRPGCDQGWFRREFRLTEGQRAVGMVAQFIERKGHRLLFDAVPAVRALCPDARFLLFGKGPLQAEVRESSVSLGMADTVRIVGFREDLHRILPCLDLLVHPAWMEGLGVSLLQAAACGVPIVAARSGGIPEACRDGENGLLVPPGDSAALAHAIGTLLQDRGRARAYGKRGRERAATGFSVAAMAAGNLAVYRRVSHVPDEPTKASR